MNKDQRARAKRLGHMHSPPVRKQEIVAANMGVSLSSVTLRSATKCSIADAKAKSPTKGAYVPLFGAGQGPEKQRTTPADKRKFAGAVDRGEKAGHTPPERKYQQANRGKSRKPVHGFRKFNATGKA